jgi:predicted phage terminase large subunit-like protein
MPEQATSTASPEEITVSFDPQPGPQKAFIDSDADIAIMGGAAGSGKSYALLMQPLTFVKYQMFEAVIFRRTHPQIKTAGGLWDESTGMYRTFKAIPKSTTLEWFFPSGAKLKFAHMLRDEDRYAWDGSQITFIGFDQLEHFTKRQFFYMLSRNRSICPVKPHIRATCNPATDHWLREFIDWWIGDDGFPLYERSGVLRWFVQDNDDLIWADTKEELINRYSGNDDKVTPTSVTFIPGKITDNKILMANSPEYVARLNALPKVERGRLLHGNWNIRDAAGEYFQRNWFEIVDAAPASTEKIRYWDRAATKAQQGKEARASWTAGLLLSKSPQGQWFIEDVERFQESPLGVEKTIDNVASQDGQAVTIGIEGDPAQAGKAEAGYHVRRLGAKGFIVYANFVHESKGTRAKSPSAQAEAGNIKLVRGKWNEAFIQEAVNFDGSKECTSDQIDALSGAFYMLTQTKQAGTWGRD